MYPQEVLAGFKSKIMKKIAKTLIVVLNLQIFNQAQNLDLNSLRIAQRQATRINNTNPSISKSNKNEDQFIIDKSIDPEKYFVGPGDKFHVNIISSNETFDHNLVISPTGTLLIPSVGIINCEGMALSKLIKEINKVIKSWNKNVKINVELDEIRKFRVLVTGQFSNAGYFIVTPMTRISDLYSQIISDYNQQKKDTYKEKNEVSYSETFGMRSRIAVDDFYERKLGIENQVENEIELLSKRNIKITRDNYSIFCDLEKFKVTGNTDYNPYLHQEDIVYIPYKNKFITIKGGVQKPGEYEYSEGDNIIDAIEIAGGLINNGKQRNNNIKITRSLAEQITNKSDIFTSQMVSETFSIKIDEAKSSKLFENDHVMVPYFNNLDPHDMVEIIGEIKYPGHYPINSGGKTVREIIVDAGGFLPYADSSKVYLNNNEIAKIPDRELERILLIEEVARSIEEKAYVKARIRTQKGSLEISSINRINTEPITNGDVIYIPRYFPYIEIIGAVNAPGRYTYNKSYKAKDYIEMAGGISKNASRKKFLVKATTGQRIKLKDKQSLENGDIIFIPELLEYNEWYVAKETVAGIYQLMLVIFYIQTIYGNR